MQLHNKGLNFLVRKLDYYQSAKLAKSLVPEICWNLGKLCVLVVVAWAEGKNKKKKT